MTLSTNIANWPKEAQYQLRERWNIREFDGGQDSDAALQDAEAEVRAEWDSSSPMGGLATHAAELTTPKAGGRL